MLTMRVVIVGILCIAATGASAQNFEHQLFSIGQNASAMARESRQAFLDPNAQAAAVQGQKTWLKMTGLDGTFTAEMPAIPHYFTISTKNVQGIPFVSHFYAVNVGTATFVIHTITYPPAIAISNPPDASLQAYLDTALKAIPGGQWYNVGWKKHQGLTVVDATTMVDGHALRVYAMFRGQTIFVAAFEGPIGMLRSADVNRLMSSLNIR